VFFFLGIRCLDEAYGELVSIADQARAAAADARRGGGVYGGGGLAHSQMGYLGIYIVLKVHYPMQMLISFFLCIRYDMQEGVVEWRPGPSTAATPAGLGAGAGAGGRMGLGPLLGPPLGTAGGRGAGGRETTTTLGPVTPMPATRRLTTSRRGRPGEATAGTMGVGTMTRGIILVACKCFYD
jgi:hypothetical protein